MGGVARVLKKCTRGRIVMSVVENVAGIVTVLSVTYMTQRDHAALDYAKTTPDDTLEQQIQTGQGVAVKWQI